MNPPPCICTRIVSCKICYYELENHELLVSSIEELHKIRILNFYGSNLCKINFALGSRCNSSFINLICYVIILFNYPFFNYELTH